ncbi:MAG: hypothetical protein RIA71_16155 [Oceanicaulis sp.]
MILDNLTRAFKTQNWFAVATEFVIVVAGVVIGFQINAWNEARDDAADEATFLVDLHSDVLLAETLSERLRERRLERLNDVRSGLDTLFERHDRDQLTAEECSTIGAAHNLNITVPGLVAFDELAASGRLGIIRDQRLKRELIAYQQAREALLGFMQIVGGTTQNLPNIFPELIRNEGYFDTELNEIRSEIFCDLEAMRANPAFLTAASQNADAYDAYVLAGLRPWSDQLTRVHARVDALLAIQHTE